MSNLSVSPTVQAKVPNYFPGSPSSSFSAGACLDAPARHGRRAADRAALASRIAPRFEQLHGSNSSDAAARQVIEPTVVDLIPDEPRRQESAAIA
jgi:hypothetical protein